MVGERLMNSPYNLKLARETPDGGRCRPDNEGCARCRCQQAQWRSPRDPLSIVTGPFTAVGGQPYCEVCYPVMAAVVHADALLLEAQQIRGREGHA